MREQQRPGDHVERCDDGKRSMSRLLSELDSECIDDRVMSIASLRKYPSIKPTKLFCSGSVAPSKLSEQPCAV
jgi:hypothetical protein